MEINFKAREISIKNVMRLNPQSKRYLPERVSFVELDLASSNDLKILKKLKRSWALSFVSDIYKQVKSTQADSVYLLTTQSENFNKLKSKNILGIAETAKSDGDEVVLEYLQTHPNYINDNSNPSPQYKGIGTALLSSIKGLNLQAIRLNSVFSAMPFYEKNGFKPDLFLEGAMIWKKQEKI